MIYAGTNEMPVYLGADEISAIYAGGEQIYPYSISGFTVKPLSIKVPYVGGTGKVRIISEYDWTATTADSWITLSAASGASGRTSITLTIDPNQTGSDLSGSVIITSTDLQHTATVDVVARTLFTPTGYINVNGGKPNITTTFKPYDVYTNSGTSNYMRIEFNNDFTGKCYLWLAGGGPNWFSFECSNRTNYQAYQNLGQTTQNGNDAWNTSGLSKTNIFTYNNNTWEMTNGATTKTGTWSGQIGNNNFALFISNNVYTNFYRMKVYDAPDAANPVFDFCPYLDENNAVCIYDQINNLYHYPEGGTITFIPFI